MHGARYMHWMVTYLNILIKLYPTKSWRPNHHAAWHIGPHLLRFGPMHGWWMFVYERVIGLLHKTNTNHKIGENVINYRYVARKWAQCTVWRFQVCTWPCGLLLSASDILAVRLHCSKIPAWSIHYITWPHLRLLSDILWIKLYQSPLSLKPEDFRYGRNGKKCARMPWCSTTASHSLVGAFIQPIHLPCAYFGAEWQIGQADLFLPRRKACLVLRLCGQTVNIMAIVPFPQHSTKGKNHLKTTIANWIIYNIVILELSPWRQASLVVSKSQGDGVSHARNIRT